MKGGHLGSPESVDLLVEGVGVLRLAAPPVVTTSTHGTGCTLSSAAAALRPEAPDWARAAREAKDYPAGALRAADRLQVGSGHGPVQHFPSGRHHPEETADGLPRPQLQLLSVFPHRRPLGP